MTGRRRFIEPLLLSLLLPLLATLAVLQIRWVTKAAAADAERMYAGLQRAGKQLVQSLTDQVSVIEWLFQVDAADLEAGRFDNLLAQWEFWDDRAAHPDLVRGVVILQSSGTGVASRWLDRKTGTPGPVPSAESAAVGELEARAFAGGFPGSAVATFVDAGSAADVPAVLVPVYDMKLPDVKKLAAGDVVVGAAAWVGVLIDPAVLYGGVLPALVDDAFSGDVNRKSYDVVIRDLASGETLFPRGTAAGAVEAADLVVPIASSGPRFMIVSKTVSSGGGQIVQETQRNLDVQDALAWMKLRKAAVGGYAASAQPADPAEFLYARSTASSGGWLLTVTHRAGSLRRAIRLIMYRNLSVSLGILAVLGASLVLLYLSFRRARRTSQRQRAFVASVSHELRTPLSVIYAAGENLSDGLIADDGKVRGYGAVIRDEGARLRDMVEKVISYSRPKPAAATDPVDIAGIVRDAAAAEAGRCAARGITCQLTATDAAVLIAGGDAVGLRALVRNVVENAIVHGGGVVRIGLSVRRARRGEEAVITVADRGPGMPASDLERLFEPFERGQAAVSGQLPGSGLGLAIAREAARAHGGSIRAESTPGEGSIFTIVLPLAARRRA